MPRRPTPFFFGVKNHFFFRRKRNGFCPCRAGPPGGEPNRSGKVPDLVGRSYEKTSPISRPASRKPWEKYSTVSVPTMALWASR